MTEEMDTLREFVALTERKRALDEQLKDAKRRLASLEDDIAEFFTEEAVQNMQIGGYTVYLQRKLWAGPVDGARDKMVAALKQADESWSFLVDETVHPGRLSSRVRECEQDVDGQPILPDELKGAIRVVEQFRIGARKT